MQIIALVILLLLSAFFSGTETAYTSVNKTRMKTLTADGNKKAKAVLNIIDKYDKFLSTMLVGNNIVNILATTISTLLFTTIMKGNASLGATVSTIVMTVVVLLFGEITPKSLAKDSADSYTLATTGVVRFITVLLTPITAIFSLWNKLLSLIFKVEKIDSVTEEEIITMIDEAQNDGEIDEHEGDLIKSAIEFNDLEVTAILTPRVDIVAIPADAEISEILDTFRTNGFSRLPVYNETIDNIIGVIHEKDFNRMLYDGLSDISAIIHDVLCITEGMKISKLLRSFQEAKAHMAVVVDEYGGTAGLVTMEDVLEGLVGDIWDEHDEVIENIKQLDEDIYLINCGMSLNDLTDIHEFDDDVLEDNATVNGWVLDNLGKIPEVGDSFEFKNLSVEVTEIDGRRATEIKLVVHPIEDEDDDDDKEKDKEKSKADDADSDDDDNEKKSDKKKRAAKSSSEDNI